METKLNPDERGYFGSFGGAFIPEMMQANVMELKENYEKIIASSDFKTEFEKLLTDYVGRPSPLYLATRLSDKYGANIYLKREDLNH
ncbi:MAG: tryptophan synthase subunit beta, partial [Reichenbachiella sp.]